jgi:putative FmdB family regulatory protein
MPVYEFECLSCGTEFTATLSVEELESGSLKCPNCGGDNIKQLMSAFVSKTSRKS